MSEFDVIIVGGGMVGAALALALREGTSEPGLKIALIDQNSLSATSLAQDSPWEPRVSAINEASRRLFSRLGIWDAMVEQRVCPYNNICVWDGEGTGTIDFDAKSSGYKNIGHIVENKVILNGLHMALKNSGIKWFENEQIIDIHLDQRSGHQLELTDDRILTAELLVAADGAESRLRRQAGIPSNQKDYLHHALVTTVETGLPHNDSARQIFLDSGPLAFLPLPDLGGKHYCSIVWSLIPEQADRIQSLNNEAFCETLSRAFEHRAGKILWADDIVRFPLRQRHARQYHRQGVVVVGDAAHTIHPLAGQGVNLGLMDVAVLAEELLRAYHRGDQIAGKHILDRYQRRRMGATLITQGAMKGFQNLFDANDLNIRWLRNTGMNLADKSHLLKEILIKQAMGINT